MSEFKVKEVVAELSERITNSENEKKLQHYSEVLEKEVNNLQNMIG